MEENTSIIIAGIKIMEPVAGLTNLIVSASGILIYLRLTSKKTSAVLRNQKWPYFFLLMGISSFLGALTHGSRFYTDDTTFYVLWLTMQSIICAGISFAQFGTIEYIFSENKNKGILNTIVWIQLALFIIIAISMKAFVVVTVHTAVGLLSVFFVNLFSYKKEKLSGRWISAGVFVAIITAVVHGQKLSIDKWFNYKDLAHVLIVVSLILMFIGVKHINATYQKTSIKSN